MGPEQQLRTYKGSYGELPLKMLNSTISESYYPSPEELQEGFRIKYGNPDEIGWSPRRRFRFGYYLPSDVYEAVLKKHIFDGCAWVDVGGGCAIFPNNPQLADLLVSRCSLVIAVDPSENVEENRIAHQRVRCPIEEFQPARQFDLATMRMVAEHVAEPARVISGLHGLLRPGGVAIVLTVNLFSPLTLISRLVPDRLHYRVKKLFWGGQEKDTFPTHYKMNTRTTLRQLFEEHGFRERAFLYLDDLALFGRFKFLNYVETLVWWSAARVGIRYPENCLLGVYERL